MSRRKQKPGLWDRGRIPVRGKRDWQPWAATPTVTSGAGSAQSGTAPQATRRPGSSAGQGSGTAQASPTPVPTAMPTLTPAPAPTATVNPATQESAPTPPAGIDEVPARDRTVFYIAGGIVLLLLLLVLLAIRRRWLNKKAGRILAALLVAGLLAVIGGGIVYGLQKKGDLNDDSLVDYDDVALFARHMVGLDSMDTTQRLAADMDSDGRLTVTDLALLIRAVEKTVRYEVTLNSAGENRSFEKNEPLQLAFQAQVTYDAAITEVTVDGTTYPAEATGSGLYTVTMDPSDTAGVKVCHVTSVTLAGGQEVAVPSSTSSGSRKSRHKAENSTPLHSAP